MADATEQRVHRTASDEADTNNKASNDASNENSDEANDEDSGKVRMEANTN